MPHKILVRTAGPGMDYFLKQHKKSNIISNISRFPCGAAEVFDLLGCYAASTDSLLLDSMSVPFARLRMPWPSWTSAWYNIPNLRPPNIIY